MWYCLFFLIAKYNDIYFKEKIPHVNIRKDSLMDVVANMIEM